MRVEKETAIAKSPATKSFQRTLLLLTTVLENQAVHLCPLRSLGRTNALFYVFISLLQIDKSSLDSFPLFTPTHDCEWHGFVFFVFCAVKFVASAPPARLQTTKLYHYTVELVVLTLANA